MTEVKKAGDPTPSNREQGGREEGQENRDGAINPTPEQIAADLASLYWTNRLQETQSSMESPDGRVQGGDFDMARSGAYLERIKAGKFFESVDISGTYDGEPVLAIESSAYDFFKRIVDSTARRMELFKNSPELVEEYRRKGDEAKKIVEAIEKTMVIEGELAPEQVAQREVAAYFSDRLVKNQEAMMDSSVEVQGGDFDMARCQAFIGQAEAGNFFDEVAFSGTYEGEPTAVTEPSVFDFFNNALKKYEAMQIQFKDDPDKANEYGKKAAQAKKVVEAVGKLKPVAEELTPLKQAENEVTAYFLTRLLEIETSLRKPDVKVQGGDFSMARCQAFIRQAKAGKFLEAFNVSGTYDGEPTAVTEPSVFDFFNNALKKYEAMQIQFKDDPDKANEYGKKAAQAKKVVDMILSIVKE